MKQGCSFLQLLLGLVLDVVDGRSRQEKSININMQQFKIFLRIHYFLLKIPNIEKLFEEEHLIKVTI